MTWFCFQVLVRKPPKHERNKQKKTAAGWQSPLGPLCQVSAFVGGGGSNHKIDWGIGPGKQQQWVIEKKGG